MTRRLLFIMLIIGLSLAMTTLAFAADDDDDNDAVDDDDDTVPDDDDTVPDDDDDAVDDDDDDGGTFYDSDIEITNPLALEADSQFEFTINVTNATTLGEEKGDWIYQVDLTMASQDYVVSEEDLSAPAPLYGATGDDTEIDRWEASFDVNTATITWQAFGVVTTVNIGDIREGDFLSFQFVATTDSVPSDGFMWVLYSDEGNVVSGTAYVGEEPDIDDDDDTAGGGDDDDDSGCGC